MTRRFTLADAMILVGATAAGFGLARACAGNYGWGSDANPPPSLPRDLEAIRVKGHPTKRKDSPPRPVRGRSGPPIVTPAPWGQFTQIGSSTRSPYFFIFL
jgi:hypothetical protein